MTRSSLALRGRIVTASNATFVGSIGDLDVVYKPSIGEQPLWDFPDGRLAEREFAAYLVSEALDWDIVPETWLGEGPHGPGMVQRWREPDPGQEPVAIVPAGDVPAGYRHVFDGLDADEQPVSLVHEDSESLRRMAVFDVVVNNADRKGGHVLAMPDGHRFGIDHGICFHSEPKLRTVLWGWAGESLTDGELAAIRSLRTHLESELGQDLAELLTVAELAALADRCDELVADGTLPGPSGSWPPIPWPPF